MDMLLVWVLVKPTLVFKGLSHSLRDCSRPCHSSSWRELEKRADKRVDLLFDQEGWIKNRQCRKWIEQFHDKTKGHVEPGTYRVLQEDNWKFQISVSIKKYIKDVRIYLANTPGNMTDLLSVIDDELGQFMKDRISLSYNTHFELNEENSRKWTEKGGFSEMDIRVFFTKWFGDAWDELKNCPDLILNTFKRCGFANDIHGRENHKVRLRHVFWYKVPPKSDEGKEYEPLTKEEIIEGVKRIREFRKLSIRERAKVMKSKRMNYDKDQRKKKKIKN